jgi:hypothetical protein
MFSEERVIFPENHDFRCLSWIKLLSEHLWPDEHLGERSKGRYVPSFDEVFYLGVYIVRVEGLGSFGKKWCKCWALRLWKCGCLYETGYGSQHRIPASPLNQSRHDMFKTFHGY